MIRPRLPIPTVISPLQLLPDPSRAIVKRQTFMPFFNGYTILMWVVCMVLVGMALTLLFSSHDHLSHFSEADADQHGEEMVTHFGRTMMRADADSADLELLVQSARLVDNLSYLVITDSIGAVKASINQIGARRAGFNLPATGIQTEAPVSVYRFSYVVRWPILDHDGFMYLGFDRVSAEAGLQRDRQYFLIIGAILIIISLFLFGSIRRYHFVELNMSRHRRARRDLAIEKGSLESEVSQHREKQAELQQSEQRYRSLLESTMQAAFKDLEKQKASLEKEVEEKTQTQQKLRQTTRRLRALNSIERKIVDEESLQFIVDHAVSELESLLGADRVSVVQLDEANETVSFIASKGKEVTYAVLDEPVPMDQFRPFKKGLFVARNLERMPELAPVEAQALEEGIRCYCRVTLTAGEKLAGALNVAFSSGERFDEDVLKVIRDVADLLSIAFRHHAHNDERQRYQEELIAERDRAEEMARLKTAFLTNMTHEIRTPLSGIIGFAQVLDEELDDERKEFAHLIQEAAKRLMTTINSVLDLSRLQADKESFRLQTLDVGMVVAETLKVIQPLAEKKGLAFEQDLPEGTTGELDRNAVEAIVNNLVGNAIKFTEQGSIFVRVGSDRDAIQIQVTDTGIGISESFLPHLFDEFRQEYMDADRLAEGSGLGLAITARIVDKLGGSIDVESTVGAGTRFTVQLPASAEAKTAADRGPSSLERSRTVSGMGSVGASA